MLAPIVNRARPPTDGPNVVPAVVRSHYEDRTLDCQTPTQTITSSALMITPDQFSSVADQMAIPTNTSAATRTPKAGCVPTLWIPI